MVTVVLDEKTGNFQVLSENNVVGEIVLMDRRHVVHVEIENEHRGSGLGPRALREAIHTLQNQLNNGNIRVSTPIDDSLEYVLKDEGFQSPPHVEKALIYRL